MMAPIFKQMAASSRFQNKAVFVKVDTNAQYELSSRYQIRSLPTFVWFLNGQVINQQVGGIGEQGLQHHTDAAVRQAELENIQVTLEALQEFYQTVDATKTTADITSVHQKCVDMNHHPKQKVKKVVTECVGAAANSLTRKLRKKYGKAPKTVVRFTEEDRQSKTSTTSSSSSDKPKKERTSSSSGSSDSSSNKPNLHLASIADLQAELERRMDEERDAAVEAEAPDEDEADPELSRRWQPGSFPEKVVIVGGGPAGMAAAIYCARAGLTPLVVAPSMGGQLQGKGVDVENYPGLHNMTGPGVIASMRKQAAHFGAVFEDDAVVGVDATSRPLKVKTNGTTGVIETHSMIVATGAESNWLNVPGEWELRGGGVSSCATCDGFLYSGKDVIVVGGGDAAMEDALVLARTSKSVTVLHRRDRFRASKVLGDRVLNHPAIAVRWNTVLQEIVGEDVASGAEGDENTVKIVSGAVLKDVSTGEESKIECDAVFIAIGHTPSTSFLKGVVEFNPDHAGYLLTFDGSTRTSVEGIFAAGDVSDAIYRQAITSAGSGAAAALDAERYLSENGLGNEEAEFEAELLAELMQDGVAATYNAYEEVGGKLHGVKESVSAGEL